MKRLYLQLNDCGSGSWTLPTSDPRAQAVTGNGWVDLTYNGTSLGGFWAENVSEGIVEGEEGAGEQVELSGRGALAILDRAVVWDWMTPGNSNIRQFWNSPDTAYCANMTNKGAILNQLMTEALTSQTNTAGDTMDRKCWHDGSGNHMISWSFSATEDSDSVAWDAAEAENLETRSGISLLTLARQYAALGMPTAPNVFDIEAVHLSTGVTDIRIHQTAIGVSAANAVIHFRKGYNCLVARDRRRYGDITNAYLIQFTHPSIPYATVSDATSITAYQRREGLLQCINASDSTTAGNFGTAELARMKNPGRQVTLKVSNLTGPKYLTDYGLGDYIYFDDGTGTEEQLRIVQIELDWDDDTPLEVTCTCEA